MDYQVTGERWKEHPCFGLAQRGCHGRLHLPVAPRCNIQCAFCDRRYDCVNESRPGVTSEILSPAEAVLRAKNVVRAMPAIRVIGIAGPGDALANEETFETCRAIRRELPDIMLCLSTNGLAMEESFDELQSARPDTVTLTVNTRCESTAKKVYRNVPGGIISAQSDLGAEIMKRQETAALLLRRAGIPFKINTVLIPGINSEEIEDIARFGAECGAEVMNILPLIPCGSLTDHPAPSAGETDSARKSAEKWLRQFTGCQRCRADACGVI